MSKLFVFASTATLCFSILPADAPAVSCDVDAEQPISANGYWFASDQERWQEFIPARSPICDVGVWLTVGQPTGGGDIFLRIEDEQAAVLGEAMIQEADLVAGMNFFDFEANLTVTPGNLHRLVLRSSEPTVVPAAYYWRGSTDSVYDDGSSDVAQSIEGFDYRFVVSSDQGVANEQPSWAMLKAKY